jgi:hypothetical protein
MRNIHFTPAATCDDSPKATQEQHSLPRLREKTNDPATEYAQRPGAVRAISDAVAACILCKSGKAIVERQQIKIQLDNETYFFTSPDSVTIAEKNGTGERVLWVINRQNPDALHILTADGAYVETLPRKGEAAWFSNDTESKRAFADATRLRNRDIARMQELHKPDTRAAIGAAIHNAAEIARVVDTFPVAGSDRQTPADRTQAGNTIAPDREPFSKAERLHGVLQRTDTARAEHYVQEPLSEEELANL